MKNNEYLEENEKLKQVIYGLSDKLYHSKCLLQEALKKLNDIEEKEKNKNGMRKFEVVSDEFRQHKDVDIILPKRGTKYSGGYDFYLPCDVEIEPNGSTGIIPTDVKARMNYGEVLLLFIRSSLGIKKDIILKNNVGVIDGDYYGNHSNDGNIGIALRNLSNEKVFLKKGERIMQGIFVKYLTTYDDETKTMRSGGFGSTK